MRRLCHGKIRRGKRQKESFIEQRCLFLLFFLFPRFLNTDSCITIEQIDVMNVQRGVEKTKLKAIQRFRDDNERIEIIVASARAHAYESRMKEELKVKEKANLMRTTGRKPYTCL